VSRGGDRKQQCRSYNCQGLAQRCLR
jgi:hypothetical protein